MKNILWIGIIILLLSNNAFAQLEFGAGFHQSNKASGNYGLISKSFSTGEFNTDPYLSIGSLYVDNLEKDDNSNLKKLSFEVMEAGLMISPTSYKAAKPVVGTSVLIINNHHKITSNEEILCGFQASLGIEIACQDNISFFVADKLTIGVKKADRIDKSPNIFNGNAIQIGFRYH